MAGDDEARPSIGGCQAFYAGVGFDDDRHSPERRPGGIRRGRIFPRGSSQSAREIPRLDGLIDPIVFLNARDVPPDHLGDRAAMRGV